MDDFKIKFRNGTSHSFFDLIEEFGFEETSFMIWSEVEDPIAFKKDLIKQIDEQDVPTTLLELLGHNLDKSDFKWLFKYLVHGYYLTRDSAWGAASVCLSKGMDPLKSYSIIDQIRLKLEFTKEYRRYYEQI